MTDVTQQVTAVRLAGSGQDAGTLIAIDHIASYRADGNALVVEFHQMSKDIEEDVDVDLTHTPSKLTSAYYTTDPGTNWIDAITGLSADSKLEIFFVDYKQGNYRTFGANIRLGDMPTSGGYWLPYNPIAGARLEMRRDSANTKLQVRRQGTWNNAKLRIWRLDEGSASATATATKTLTTVEKKFFMDSVASAKRAVRALDKIFSTQLLEGMA